MKLAARNGIYFILLFNFKTVLADDYFNPEFIEGGDGKSKSVDLSHFENIDGQIPGRYFVQIFVNGERKESTEIVFFHSQTSSAKGDLTPCLSLSQLKSWGVNVPKFFEESVYKAECVDLTRIDQALSVFKMNDMKLVLSFPQSAMTNVARGTVSPNRWDDGINSFLLNYDLTANSRWQNQTGQRTDNYYVNLRPGINFDAWRIRSNITWSKSVTNWSSGTDDQNDAEFDIIYSYASRSFAGLKSRLTVGDAYTSADIFNSVSFRGIQLESDEDMLPYSLRGYAPVVRGIARTNAEVQIHQNGRKIYSTFVYPGNFEISDLFATAGGGDLTVTVVESDGNTQRYEVPFASLPVLRREGSLKYSATSGIFRNSDASVNDVAFSQGTVSYGLPKGLTLYGGAQFSSKYRAVAAGLGTNLGKLGAISFDVTRSWSDFIERVSESGNSYKLRYSKYFSESGTNFSMAGYQYSTKGYWVLSDVLNQTSYYDELAQIRSDIPTTNNLYTKPKQRFELVLTQGAGSWGSLSVAAAFEEHRESNRNIQSLNTSYNNSFGCLSYGLGFSYSSRTALSFNGITSVQDKDDMIFSFNISAPIEELFGVSQPVYSSMASSIKSGGSVRSNAIINGSMLEGRSLNWGLYTSYDDQSHDYDAGVNLDLKTRYGEFSSGFVYDSGGRRFNYGARGSLLAHSNGATFGQQMGETVALVAVPDVEDIAIENQIGIKTDANGYAILPYVTPYRNNFVSLDPRTFGHNVEVNGSAAKAVPTRGAVVLVEFNSRIGERALVTLQKSDGSYVPFGATVIQSDNNDKINIVSDFGQVYLAGLPKQGTLFVKWGRGDNEQCQFDYQIPDKKIEKLNFLNAICL